STPSSEKGVTTANVNFRKSASTSSSIIATIPKNTTVEVVDKSNSKWYKVKYKGNTGYVSKDYVKLNGSNSNTSSSNKGVTSANLNLRKSTSTSSSIITTIPKNTTIEIVNKLSSGWYKVKYKSYTGYVVGSYIKI
ncbi:SH3 domain-containing protein, partial [Terrisporobacter glycolicus]|uniref:SH3 domain-containing protein n=1 Tax=Terrisporobacter glycolicus TaxID=36841 RepID=UPI003463CAE5